ncbi:hypothetical protein ACIRBX_33975 [Kitasatospora sp. NPDC096147]|uniref:hypothetical protein n=1 Tax=Kitasatospora sp. NPDC096147 TaxID=3364093 RepID=UPI0038297206
MTAIIGAQAPAALFDHAIHVWRRYPDPFAGTAQDEIDADRAHFLARLSAIRDLPPGARNESSGHWQRSCGGGAGVTWPRHRDYQVAGLLEHRLRRGTDPASLRLLASALAGIGPAGPLDPEIRRVVGRHDPQTVARAGRWLVRNGTDEHTVTAGLVLLIETATERELPLLRTIGLLTRFAASTSLALEGIPGGAAVLIELAEHTSTCTPGRDLYIEALLRLAAPRTRYSWRESRTNPSGVHPRADPDRPDDPGVMHWLRRKADDGGDFTGYFAADVVIAAGITEVIADSFVDAEVVDHTGRLLCALTWCGGMGATLDELQGAPALLRHYREQVARLAPTSQRCRTVLCLLAAFTGEPRPGAQVVWSEDEHEAYRAQLAALLTRPAWRDCLRAVLALPSEGSDGWTAAVTGDLGVL